MQISVQAVRHSLVVAMRNSIILKLLGCAPVQWNGNITVSSHETKKFHVMHLLLSVSISYYQMWTARGLLNSSWFTDAVSISVAEHPWIQNAKKASNVPLGDIVRTRLKQFSVMNRFKKKALRVSVFNWFTCHAESSFPSICFFFPHWISWFPFKWWC